jgi:signal transduction histidine kinase/CheY-like chemotaxis protein
LFASTPWHTYNIVRRGFGGDVLSERDREYKLRRLIDAGLLLHQDLSLEIVLSRFVELAAQILEAKYSALASLDAQGGIKQFLHHGMTPEQVAAMPHLPVGKGLLGALMLEGRPLRVGTIAQHSASVGFPEGHPPMKSFLGVPILMRGKVYGRLYCAEKLGGGEFTVEDEELAVLLAAQAAVAIENAELYETARSASRLKSEFMANMSHELRTPMNAILGFTELVMNGALGPVVPKQKDGLGRVMRNARNLLDLINDILDLSKIEAGRMTLVEGDFVPRALVESCLASVESLAAQKNLRLTFDAGAGAGHVRGDEGKARQIVINLLSNAIKFTEHGEIAVRLEWAEDRWSVSVEDAGIGIAPEHLGLIFEEFRQVDASSTRHAGGTGLGLAISQKMAQLMGGEITVQSVLGQGSTFTLHLPVLPSTQSFPVRSVTPQGARRPAGLVLLSIDDDPDVLALMTSRLSQTEFSVVTAQGGEEGLRLAETLRPDVITLDVLMPGLDGWEVLRRLKANPALAHVPVIMLTIQDNRAHAFGLGAADCLAKPISRDRLLDVLRRLAAPAPGSLLLIVDDEADSRALVRNIVVAAGYEAAEAENGRQALEMIADRRPDLVVLDLLMPEMDGFLVLEALGQDPELRLIPVVILTALGITPEDEERLSRSAQRILHKAAVTPDALLAELRGVLHERVGAQR